MNRILLALLLLFSSQVFADWSQGVNVKEIVAEGNEEASSFVIIVSSSIASTFEGDTCSGTYHYLNASTEKGKLMFTLLLTAKTTDSGVRLLLQQVGGNSRCQIMGVR